MSIQLCHSRFGRVSIRWSGAHSVTEIGIALGHDTANGSEWGSSMNVPCDEEVEGIRTALTRWRLCQPFR